VPQTSHNRVLTPLGLGLALSLLGDATLYAVLPSPIFAAQAGITLAMVGLVLGVNRLVRIVFNGPAGYLYDRLPRRPILLTSIFIGAFSTALYALSSGIVLMMIGRVLWGLAWSGIWIGANTMALDISQNHNRGKVNGRLQMWFYIGVATSSMFGGLFTDLFTYRGGLWVSSALTFLGFLMWLKFLPETKPALAPSEEPKQALSIHGFPWFVTFSCAAPYFVMRFVFAGVLAATTILWLSQFIPENGFRLNGWAIPLATLSGVFIAVRVLVSVISAPQIGRFSDFIGKRWLVLVVILLIFGGGGLWLLSLPIFSLSLIGALLAAVSGGSIPAIVPAIVGDQVNLQQRSRVLGLIFTVGDLGSALGPPFALGLIPVFGLNTIYAWCAGLYALTALLAAFFAFREKKASSDRAEYRIDS
jgi:MFS family permease